MNFCKKSPNVTWSVTERVNVRGPVSVDECKIANTAVSTISVRLNLTRRENNRSSFGAFSGSTLSLGRI